MTLRPGAKDRSVDILCDRDPGIDRLAALVHPFGRIVRQGPANHPKKPPRQMNISAPRL
jgi:hypothetical protein